MWSNAKAFPNATLAWLHILDTILTRGNTVKPRNMSSKEILHNSVSFYMGHPIVISKLRKLSYKFMAAEALWILSGSNAASEIVPYNQNIAQFSDNGYVFNGAYGPHFNSQLAYVINKLCVDINTRQAVMTFWVPNPLNSRDIPCTISLTFNIRNNKLNCHVFMRSSDAWLGVPYDFFSFTMIAVKVVCKLNEFLFNGSDFTLNNNYTKPIELGTLFWTGVSSHLYEHNCEKAQLCLAEVGVKEGRPIPIKYITNGNFEYFEQSLIACRDMQENNDLWRIRP